MADIKTVTKRNIDLDTGTKFDSLPQLVSGTSGTRKFELTCKNGAAAADLSGAVCNAVITNANDQSIPVDGEIVDNVASVLLTGGCTAVPGRLLIIVFLTDAGATNPIYYASTSVAPGSSDVVIDENDLVLSLPELLAQIAACEDAEAAALAAAALAQNAAASLGVFANGSRIQDKTLFRAQLHQSDCNYSFIPWKLANLFYNTATEAEEVPGSGEYRVSEFIPVPVSTRNLYVRHDKPTSGDGNVYIHLFDADYTRLGTYDGPNNYQIEPADGVAFIKFSCLTADCPARVSITNTYRRAFDSDVAFYDRLQHGLDVNESINGGTSIGGENGGYEDTTITEEEWQDPYYGPSTSRMYGDLTPGKTYFFLKFKTETGAVIHDNPANSYIGVNVDGGTNWDITRISFTDNILFLRYDGETAYTDEEMSMYLALRQIKDAAEADYLDGIRLDEFWFLTSDYDPEIIYDILSSGNRLKGSTKYAEIAQLAKAAETISPEALAAVVEAVGTDNNKADKLAIQHGYVSSPFGAADWEQGSINGTYGTDLNDEPWYSTQLRLIPFFTPDEVDVILAKGGYRINGIYKYELDGTFLGPTWVEGPMYSDFEEGYKYRVTMINADESAILPAECTNILLLSGRLASIKRPYRSDDIRFTVSVNQDFDDNDGTAATIQDSETMVDVSCLLRLPESYTPDGTPTKLVYAAHGAGWWIAGGNDGSMDDFDTLLANGYALFDVNGSNDTNPTHCGSPRAMQATHKAYKYIVEHYNVEPFIFAAGISMGGTSALNFTHLFPEIVKAVGVFCPRINLGPITIGEDEYTGLWDDAGYQEIFGGEYNFTDPEVWEADKVCGYDPYDTRTIINDAGERCTLFPVPIKIWHGIADPTIEYQISAEYAAQIQRAGTDCRLRLLTGVGHETTEVMKTELLYWFSRFS